MRILSQGVPGGRVPRRLALLLLFLGESSSIVIMMRSATVWPLGRSPFGVLPRAVQAAVGGALPRPQKVRVAGPTFVWPCSLLCLTAGE
jgi:hypothetical protein